MCIIYWCVLGLIGVDKFSGVLVMSVLCEVLSFKVLCVDTP